MLCNLHLMATPQRQPSSSTLTPRKEADHPTTFFWRFAGHNSGNYIPEPSPVAVTRTSLHIACFTSPPARPASDVADLSNSGRPRLRTLLEFVDPNSINAMHHFLHASTSNLGFSTIVSRVPAISNNFQAWIWLDS
ncbi:hypothetical protein PanWU01x14_009680 [Parasponia andersonii]|uniref:Uncharacterized protein n=1 Tax=Parasponia andersonii TaxID=3476 RepID=A0A2P5E2H3_PARAD|nr:hypothetical protein PanWU01x14_009680 [Parasponia andersonii]